MRSSFDKAVAALQISAEDSRRALALSACPRAELIVMRNRPEPLDGGMVGGLQVFGALLDPRTFKRKAAETILYLRRNRAALKSMGRCHHRADAVLLERARSYRLRAAQLIASKKGE